MCISVCNTHRSKVGLVLVYYNVYIYAIIHTVIILTPSLLYTHIYTYIDEPNSVCTAPITVSDASTDSYPVLQVNTMYRGYVDCNADGLTPSYYYRLPSKCTYTHYTRILVSLFNIICVCMFTFAHYTLYIYILHTHSRGPLCRHQLLYAYYH